MSNTSERGSFSPDDIAGWFWDVIAQCARSRNRLQMILEGMSRDEIIRFDNAFQEAASQLLDEPFTDFMDESISEDGAKDVADFVVSQGKAYYTNIWDHPDQIPEFIPPGERNTLAGVAEKVFWTRFQDRIPQETDS